ncbi:MAG: hypothetical protein LDL11_06595 [Desulfarculus sp.]|nr:hypothetical protein [Desulfarculus sp.]
MSKSVDLSAVVKAWPPIIARADVGHYTGGVISAKTLANHDCAGTGPKRLKIGRKIAYRAEDLAAWLAGKAVDLA